jgi:hypothetical protein
MSTTWAGQELGQASLGDARLSRRLVKLATRLAENPSASIPQACRGWAEMRAAYRFLAQANLNWQDILQPHLQASEQRMRQHPVVLCLQDTTELDFEGKRARAGAAELRGPARDVPAPDLCDHARTGAAGRDRCLDVGA